MSLKDRIKAEFEGKRVTLMRLGLLGRGVGDAAFLSEAGAKVLVVDSASEEVMQPSVDALSEHRHITFKFGPYDTADFEECDMVLKGAGTPIDSPEIAAALANDVPVEMSASLFLRLANIPMVGVTGTRGKSTVTHMIHHVLRESTDAGADGSGVILGGNVRGVSNLQLLKDVREDSIGVFELDSWQLQGFGYARMSPQIAVFTSFMPDHMNYYHNDLDAYFGDKAQIFLHQQPGDVLVTTPEVFRMVQAYATKHGLTFRGEVILADASSLPEDTVLAMPGEHNKVNAALAAEALRAMSLSDEHIAAGLSSFRGVEGRLEYLGEHRGVKIYNDNNATTPEATRMGIRAVASGKNVVLIMGGADKALPFESLLPDIKSSVKEVVLLPGTGTDTIRAHIPGAHDTTRLEDAVTRAFELAENGDVVLFSPGFASFGLFKNEYERNDQFLVAVKPYL